MFVCSVQESAEFELENLPMNTKLDCARHHCKALFHFQLLQAFFKNNVYFGNANLSRYCRVL